MLRYPKEVAAEMETALAWWASFGGLGARTRRGFGAIQIANVPLIIAKTVEEAGGRLQLTGSGSTKADTEWKTAIDRLFSFRQKGSMARKAGNPRPGRSYWPEPDQIRRFTNVYLPRHAPEHVAENVFPRAAFGLPITFKFYSPAPENYAVELIPESDSDCSDRMASPLILRPYWNGEKWQPAALLLPGWERALRQPLKFKEQKSYQPAHWPDDAARRKQLAADIPPMAGRADDPLSAFMQFFTEGK
jgi:CRISPR-associated protein Cmr1